MFLVEICCVEFLPRLNAYLCLQVVNCLVQRWQVYRVRNPALWQKYEVTKRQMEKRIGPTMQAERWLWHGADETAVASINKEGFNRSYSGVNGTLSVSLVTINCFQIRAIWNSENNQKKNCIFKQNSSLNECSFTPQTQELYSGMASISPSTRATRLMIDTVSRTPPA